MRFVLAVDSGGSKCETVLAREDGVVMGWGICRIPGLSGRSSEAIRRATREALSTVAAEELRELWVGCLDLAVTAELFGVNDPFEIHVQRVGEYEGGLYLTGNKDGIVVLAGTGAFVHVQTPDGRSVRYDSFGPMLGDWGSGYQIGLMALRATMRAGWHPRHATGIAEMVLAAFQVESAMELVPVSLANPDRCVVAALASGVADLAKKGDPVAGQIIRKAAEDLADTLKDAVDSMHLEETELAMVGTGSVIKQSAMYWEHFCCRAARFAPRLRPVLEPMSPAVGMVLAVLHRLPGIDEKRARENLIESAREYLEKKEREIV